MIARHRRWMSVLVLTVAAGCRGSTDTPEAGALLLRVGVAAGAQAPDELRLYAYDDSGTLWSNARFPSEGTLKAQSASFLGTILIQPGTTVGNLRFDVRGLLGGALVDEAILIVTPAERATATFDVSMSAALPSDGDGDGVPDPIDDCPSVADPTQTGCTADAGATGGTAGTTGSGGSAGQAGAMSAGGSSGRAGAGGPGGHAGAGGAAGLDRGTACESAAQCGSGFCKDGVCCDTACTDACNSCATGTCTPVTNGEDAPECVAPMSCNKKGKCVGS